MNEQVNYAKIQRIQDDLDALVIGQFGTGFCTDAMLYESGIKATVADHTSQLADNKTHINSNSINVKYPLSPLVGALGDGTDETTILQNIINSAQTGQRIIFPKGTYYFTSLTIPTGVHLDSAGGVLYGGTINISKSVAQEYNTSFNDIWFKRCRFVMDIAEGSSDLIDNVQFNRCFLDGTDLNNQYTYSGDCVTIKKNVFDIKFSETSICNYGGNAVLIQGNTVSDLSGTPYLATGVFMTFTDFKAFNCGYGIKVMGSCMDGASIHMSNVLLDHCVTGLYIDNNPLASGAGEINVYGNNVRIELCDQAIYNDGGKIFIEGIWSFGKSVSTDNKVINNVSGYMNITGRLAAGSTVYAVYNTDGATCIVNGILGGGLFYNIRQYISVENATQYNPNIRYLRVKIIKSATTGLINAQIISASDKCFGRGLLSNVLSADFGANTNATVGTGMSAVIYGLSGTEYFTLDLPFPIGRILTATIQEQNTGNALTLQTYDQSDAYFVCTFRKTDGTLLSLTALTEGQYIEFTIGLSD